MLLVASAFAALPAPALINEAIFSADINKRLLEEFALTHASSMWCNARGRTARSGPNGRTTSPGSRRNRFPATLTLTTLTDSHRSERP
jgi:hypothetical protein